VTRPEGESFQLDLRDGTRILADSVVLACPAWSAAPLLRELDAALAGAVAEIPSAPVVVVHLGFDEQALGGSPNGFGYLVPSGEGLRTLGTLWTSSIFLNRAPQGSVLLTSMIGGARYPGAAELSGDQAQAIALGELQTTMGITVKPRFVRVFKHEHGIPQYTLGHPGRLETIERRLREHEGLYVAGNSYRGISMNACIEEARNLADTILEAAGPRGRPPSNEEAQTRRRPA
jgi:oxygen-dependent protoporphyrinogen oxidase